MGHAVRRVVSQSFRSLSRPSTRLLTTSSNIRPSSISLGQPPLATGGHGNGIDNHYRLNLSSNLGGSSVSASGGAGGGGRTMGATTALVLRNMTKSKLMEAHSAEYGFTMLADLRGTFRGGKRLKELGTY